MLSLKVPVDFSPYRAKHRKSPRERRRWRFIVVTPSGEQVHVIDHMRRTYRRSLAWIMERADTKYMASIIVPEQPPSYLERKKAEAQDND